ncbi:MAG: manganese efflux pump MntP family protein [Candidatus Marinimicrobia bacterium]|nr:manganese efflux pump MntP family protein [Candidatus Neomarinimicrobiota bacterium]MCF7904447.1 manganese efflux pump MntP family protein [Candidatus Neomarinimicrobiota bacterium]
MSLLEIVLIAIGLAMDASAVSMTAAAAGYAHQKRQVFRLAFHFGLFQGIMPLLGWLLGSTVVSYIENWDHWVAFALLAIVGGRMVVSWFEKDEEKLKSDPTRGWTLITLSVATSIDALAVGLSFSLLDVSIWLPCLLIGMITLILSIAATQIGKVAGRFLGKQVEVLGGLILIGIGLRILITHLA